MITFSRKITFLFCYRITFFGFSPKALKTEQAVADTNWPKVIKDLQGVLMKSSVVVWLSTKQK